jgi:hypothetical protein
MFPSTPVATLAAGQAPQQRICGWCRIELAPGTLPASHGICQACYVRLEGDITEAKTGVVQ